jgi:hypothetical protein
VRHPNKLLFFFQFHFIHHIIHYHKKNYGRQNASTLSHSRIYCYGVRQSVFKQNVTRTPTIQLLNKISYVSWYSISIRSFSHIVPIYGINSLFKIYKRQIKGFQIPHVLFYDHTLFRLSPIILLGPPHGIRVDSIRLWRVATIKLNKRLRTADKEWASSLWGWTWGQHITVKDKPVTKIDNEPWIWEDFQTYKKK